MNGNSIFVSLGILAILKSEVMGKHRKKSRGTTELNSEDNVLNMISSFLQQHYWKNVVLITNHKDIKGFTRRMSSELVPFSIIFMNSTFKLNLLERLKEFSTKIIIWCDFNCVDITLQTAKTNSLLRIKNSWLVIINEKQCDTILVRLCDILKYYLQEDSIVFTLIPSLPHQSIMQYEEFRFIYYRFPETRVEFQAMGSYHGALDHRYRTHDENIQQRLRGYHFTVGVLQYPPFMICDYIDGHLHFKGFLADLIAALAVPLGFTYNFLHSRKDSFPGNLINGTWNGVMGLLQRQEANLTGLGINMDRHQDAEFVGNMFVTPAGVAFRSPTETPTLDMWSYLQPFSDSVWILTLICWVALSVFQLSFKPSVKNSDQFWENINKNKKIGKFSKIVLQSLHVMEIFINAGYKPLIKDRRRKGSSKLLLLTFLIFILLLRHSYTSVLISTNTVQKSKFVFNDIADLVEFGYRGAVPKNSMFEDQLKKDQRERYKRIWKIIQSDPSNLVPSAKEGLQRVCRERYAFVDTSFIMANMASQYCRFEMITSVAGGIYVDLFLAKNSPYSDIFFTKMLELRSNGVLHQLNWKHEIRRHLAPTISKTHKASVHFLVMAPAFVLLGSGYVLSFLLLCVEFGIILLCGNKQSTESRIHTTVKPNNYYK